MSGQPSGPPSDPSPGTPPRVDPSPEASGEASPLEQPSKREPEASGQGPEPYDPRPEASDPALQPSEPGPDPYGPGLQPSAQDARVGSEASRPEGAILLEASGLGKQYPTAAGPLAVLWGLDFVVRAGEMVAVVGESGTGKSTLLHLLGALDRPTEGGIRYRGEDVYARGDEALAAFRNRAIGFVFQFHHLLPEFTAAENVGMPALIAGKPDPERALALLESLGLAARADHRPSQLSGGEQQRVAVARALMNRPGLVLMDEPTGNLDTRTATRLHDELHRLSREGEQAFVVVTHNPALAERADRVLRLEGGRLHPA